MLLPVAAGALLGPILLCGLFVMEKMPGGSVLVLLECLGKLLRRTAEKFDLA